MDMKILQGFVKGRQDAIPKVSPHQVRVVSDAERRVAKMSTHDLIEWADAAGSGMAKGFDDYRSHHTIESLYEIRTALVALAAVTEELIIREEAEND